MSPVLQVIAAVFLILIFFVLFAWVASVFTSLTEIVIGTPFALLVTLFLSRRGKKEERFTEQNIDKAILHFYSRKTSIDGAPVADFNPLKGQYLQRVVALAPGIHTFEGCLLTTDETNFRSKSLQLILPLQAGHVYTLALYLYSPEQIAAYFKGDVGRTVIRLPVTVGLTKTGIPAYIICYQEDAMSSRQARTIKPR